MLCLLVIYNFNIIVQRRFEINPTNYSVNKSARILEFCQFLWMSTVIWDKLCSKYNTPLYSDLIITDCITTLC